MICQLYLRKVIFKKKNHKTPTLLRVPLEFPEYLQKGEGGEGWMNKKEERVGIEGEGRGKRIQYWLIGGIIF